jgi:hypothetical protein
MDKKLKTDAKSRDDATNTILGADDPMDTKKQKSMPSVATTPQDAIIGTGKPLDVIGHGVTKSTQSVAAPVIATPPNDTYIEHVTPQVTGYKSGNTTKSVTTPFVAKPPQNVIFSIDELRDAIGHDVGKPTPSVARTVDAMTPKEAIFSLGEPRNPIGHDVGKPTPSVAVRRDSPKKRHIWHKLCNQT